MKVSVVVPTFGERPEYLRDAIESMCAQEPPPGGFEVIVVDNSRGQAVTSSSAEAVRAAACEVRIVRESRVGLHYARHAGAREARGEIVVYIDDDVLAPRGWLLALTAVFDDPTVSCAGGPAIAKWEADVPAWYGQFDGGYLSLLDLGAQRRRLTYPACVWGCNMAVRRSALFAVGGFNPDGIGDRRSIWLRGDGECGLQEKLTDAGLGIVYEPAAWLEHRIPASRLTPEYFYWRFFTQGIQESYVRVRRARNGVAALLLTPLYTLYCVVQMIRFYARSLLGGSQRYFSRALAWMYYGRAAHQIRLLLSPALRRHVLRTSYFDDEPVSLPHPDTR